MEILWLDEFPLWYSQREPSEDGRTCDFFQPWGESIAIVDGETKRAPLLFKAFKEFSENLNPLLESSEICGKSYSTSASGLERLPMHARYTSCLMPSRMSLPNAMPPHPCAPSGPRRARS